jgi:mRNA capping enzyme, beta chain
VFYELPPTPQTLGLLPPSIRSVINTRHKIKVRVTTDNSVKDRPNPPVLAQIIKHRIADLNVFSPRTSFDWRISVSLEMNWAGDVDSLEAMAQSNTGDASGRDKDRMSYKHLSYQVDLTQVKPIGVSS